MIPAAHQHRGGCRGLHAEPAGGLVLFGHVSGRELRSDIAPSARYRSAHFCAVRGAIMNVLAAAA